MQHIKNDFSRIPWGGLNGWGQGQNLTFPEYGHVAYPIKANMEAFFLPTDTPSTQGVGSKGRTIFLEVVILYIKLKGIDHRAQ